MPRRSLWPLRSRKSRRHTSPHQRRRSCSSRLEQLEGRLCLSVFYEYDVIAQTGGSTPFNLTSLGAAPSINDNGYIAFTAASNNGDGQLADNIYAWNPNTRGLNRLMNDVFMLPKAGIDELTGGTQSIFGEVQINNNNVLARRRLNAVVQVGFSIATPTPTEVQPPQNCWGRTWTAAMAGPGPKPCLRGQAV